LLASIASGFVSAIPRTLGVFVGGAHGGWVLTAIGAVLASLVSTPLLAIFSTLVYFDGRIRQEGLDLELMAAALEARSTPV
jgi:hypothetical protein